MSKLFLLIATCIILSLTSSSILAQNTSNRKPITPENVNQLAELTSLSGGRGYQFSPDNQWLAVGWKNFRVFDLQQDLLLTEPVVQTDVALSWIFSPNGRFLVITNNDINTLFDLSTGSETSSLAEIASTMGGGGVSYTYSFSPDSTMLAILNNFDRKLKLLSLETGEISDISTPNVPFTEILFTSNGAFIALSPQTCGPWSCNTLFVVDAVTGHQILQNDTMYVNSAAISPDGSLLAYGDNTIEMEGDETVRFPLGTIQVINLASDQKTFYVASDQAVVGPVLFSPDGSQLVYSTLGWLEDSPDWASSAIHIIDIETQEETVLESKGIAKFLSPNGEMLYSNSSVDIFKFPDTITYYGEGAFITDIETGQTVLEHAGMGVIPVAFSPNSQLFAASGLDEQNTISIYKSVSGNKVTSLSIEGMQILRQLGFSPDGTILAASYQKGDEDVLTLWGIP